MNEYRSHSLSSYLDTSMACSQWQHLLRHPRSVRNWENAAVVTTLCLILPTIDMGIWEKYTHSKMLQTNTIGITIRMYWISMYIIDLLFYILFIVLYGIIMLCIYRRTVSLSAVQIGTNFEINRILAAQLAAQKHFWHFLYHLCKEMSEIKLIKTKFLFIQRWL